MLKEKVYSYFPGHMAKAIREIKEKIYLIDLVIELRDSRVCYISENKEFEELFKKKPRIILLTKSLFSDLKKTQEFIKSSCIPCLDVCFKSNYNTKKIHSFINKNSLDIIKKRREKNIINKEIKILVVGLPNVGKSTFINFLKNKKSLSVGNRPGITKRCDKFIKISDEFILLDTPGIIYPKFESKDIFYKLASCGILKDELLDLKDYLIYMLDFLYNNYFINLQKRYDLPNNIKQEELIDFISRKTGCLEHGANISYTKLARLIYNDLKNSRLGGISYE